MSTDRPEPQRPHKVVLGSFSSHAAAQHTVDVLARHGFPVEHVTIVGTNLRLQEVVLGRWTLGRALVTGAVTGGWIGLLVGLVFLVVSPWTPVSVLYAVGLGIVLGLIWAAVARVWQRRSFAAIPAVVADRYDVLVDAQIADEARRILALRDRRSQCPSMPVCSQLGKLRCRSMPSCDGWFRDVRANKEQPYARCV